MTLAELEEKLSLMSRSSTCNVEPSEAWQMLAALRKAVLAEREACAQVADAAEAKWRSFQRKAVLKSDEWQHRQQASVAADVATEIRARGSR